MAGWVSLLASLGLALVNLEYGAAGFSEARDELTRAYDAREKFNEEIPKRRNRIIQWLNRGSLVLLLVGVSCLILFAIVNI